MVRKLSALCLFSCSAPATELPPDEAIALEVVELAWDAAGIGDPGDCLDGTRVRWASDDADFLAHCRAPVGYAAACLTYRHEQHGARVHAVPEPFLAPGQPLLDTQGGAAVHEWLHALAACRGDVDADHTSPRIWIAAGGDESAQGRARAVLNNLVED